MVALTLRHSGYEVVCARNAHHALTLALDEEFDLLLLDNWMPGISGLELTREIRMRNTTTPILFYSGVATKVDIQEALNAGAQGYLLKPLGVNELICEIEKLIERGN
jgi:DNA-binding response OmpR family regulator